MRWRRIALPGEPVNRTGANGESKEENNMFSSKSRFVSAVLIAAVLFSGCTRTAETEESAQSVTEAVSSIESQEPIRFTDETTSEPESYKFNTHAYSSFLEACYSEDYKRSLFNFFDALQDGKDTFECASEEIYEYCMDSVVQNQLYPVACCQLLEKSPDGDPSFENGTGHIYYKYSKENFLEKQARFQQEVEAIMNEWIRPDYSDFEKCLALYEYIATNYYYDHDGVLQRSEDGSGCTTLYKKLGICADYGPWYAYLLMQCGVNAIAVSNFGTENSLGYHAWTYVEINGKCYHIDATWALNEDSSVSTVKLDYFMMTDDDRAQSGYPPELLEAYLVPGFYAKDCPGYRFVADDKTYRLPEWSVMSRFDAENNIIYYTDNTGDHQFRYG